MYEKSTCNKKRKIISRCRNNRNKKNFLDSDICRVGFECGQYFCCKVNTLTLARKISL